MKSHIKTAEIILSALPYTKVSWASFCDKIWWCAQTDDGLKSD